MSSTSETKNRPTILSKPLRFLRSKKKPAKWAVYPTVPVLQQGKSQQGIPSSASDVATTHHPPHLQQRDFLDHLDYPGFMGLWSMAMQQEPIEIGGTYCWSMSCSVGDLPEKSVNFLIGSAWSACAHPQAYFWIARAGADPRKTSFKFRHWLSKIF